MRTKFFSAARSTRVRVRKSNLFSTTARPTGRTHPRHRPMPQPIRDLPRPIISARRSISSLCRKATSSTTARRQPSPRRKPSRQMWDPPWRTSPDVRSRSFCRAATRKTHGKNIPWCISTTDRTCSFPAQDSAHGTPTVSPTTRHRRGACARPSSSPSPTATPTDRIGFTNIFLMATPSRITRTSD